MDIVKEFCDRGFKASYSCESYTDLKRIVNNTEFVFSICEDYYSLEIYDISEGKRDKVFYQESSESNLVVIYDNYLSVLTGSNYEI